MARTKTGTLLPAVICGRRQHREYEYLVKIDPSEYPIERPLAMLLARRLKHEGQSTTLEVQRMGNHDVHSGRQDAIADMLADVGVHVLHGSSVVLPIRDTRLAVAGVTGFGGAFPGGTIHAFGEQEIKDLAARGRQEAQMQAAALAGLEDGPREALTHYAPTADTPDGEPPELYPLLGSRLLGEAIDQAGVTLSVHGHAHHGVEHGRTTGGVPVRNVARRVIQAPYRVYHLYPSSTARMVATASQPAVQGGGDAA